MNTFVFCVLCVCTYESLGYHTKNEGADPAINDNAQEVIGIGNKFDEIPAEVFECEVDH